MPKPRKGMLWTSATFFAFLCSFVLSLLLTHTRIPKRWHPNSQTSFESFQDVSGSGYEYHCQDQANPAHQFLLSS